MKCGPPIAFNLQAMDMEGQVMAIDLVPLCTMRIQAKPPVEVGAGPAGTRMVFEEAAVEVRGDRLAGQLGGSAGDCVLGLPLTGERPRPRESTAVHLIRPDALLGHLGIQERP